MAGRCFKGKKRVTLVRSGKKVKKQSKRGRKQDLRHRGDKAKPQKLRKSIRVKKKGCKRTLIVPKGTMVTFANRG